MGVRISFGTDAEVFAHERNAGEFALPAERGMSPIAALKTAAVRVTETVLLVTKCGVVYGNDRTRK